MAPISPKHPLRGGGGVRRFVAHHLAILSFVRSSEVPRFPHVVHHANIFCSVGAAFTTMLAAKVHVVRICVSAVLRVTVTSPLRATAPFALACDSL